MTLVPKITISVSSPVFDDTGYYYPGIGREHDEFCRIVGRYTLLGYRLVGRALDSRKVTMRRGCERVSIIRSYGEED